MKKERERERGRDGGGIVNALVEPHVWRMRVVLERTTGEDREPLMRF